MEDNNNLLEHEVISNDGEQKQELNWLHHILLFIGGYFLISILASVVNIALKPISESGNTMLASTLLSLIVYVLMFITLSLVLYFLKLLKDFYIPFTKLTPYLKGVFYGFLIIIASVSYSSLVALLFGPQDSNTNQQAIENVLTSYPILNFMWIVLLGPLVEEYIYRVGLFSGLRKVNRILAYVVSGLIFGFIHFTIPLTASGTVDSARLLIEFINIPSYIISGLLFAYVFEKEGFATSSIAHITNNLVSFVVTIIYQYV